jgi:hypothetical protein
MHNLAKKGPNSARTETVAVRLDPKLRYLVRLAAEDQQRTMSNFIEYVLRRALTDGTFNQEPNYGADPAFPPTPKPMAFEGFYDEDQADRLFLLATGRPDLMTAPEANLFKLLKESMAVNGEKRTLQSFRAYFHNSAVNKSHLNGEESNA